MQHTDKATQRFTVANANQESTNHFEMSGWTCFCWGLAAGPHAHWDNTE